MRPAQYNNNNGTSSGVCILTKQNLLIAGFEIPGCSTASSSPFWTIELVRCKMGKILLGFVTTYLHPNDEGAHISTLYAIKQVCAQKTCPI